jgi:hypothetical protein
MKKIDITEAHIISSANQTTLTEEEWQKIADQKPSYIISDECDTKYMMYPGLVFSNEKAREAYEPIYQAFIDSGANTPARGNLSRNNTFIFIGIRPGHAYAHLCKTETAWIFGPSSKILQHLLLSLKIYPYLTNVYNDYRKSFDKDLNFIVRELETIVHIYKNIYGINELNFVYMGSYAEYESLKRYDFGIKVNNHSIWHPAYLARAFTKEKFQTWQNMIGLSSEQDSPVQSSQTSSESSAKLF